MNDIGLNYTDDMYYLVILLGKDGQQRKAEYNSSACLHCIEPPIKF